MSPLKVVFFDALFTLVQPRLPIIEQYRRVFAHHHIPEIDVSKLKPSFKTALAQLQFERPAYRAKQEPHEDDVRSWWAEVIRRTAIGAGADVDHLDASLGDIVTELLHIFSSKDGYKLADGAVQTLHTLNNELGVRTGLVSNSDSRILRALDDLGVMSFLDPVIISEHEGVEKPDRRIWQIACRHAGVNMNQAAHVGDEYDADVIGALQAGLNSVWFRPVGQELQREQDAQKAVPEGVALAGNMLQVVDIVKRWNNP